MKRLIVCCDGTWNEIDYRVRPTTNVVKLAQSVHAYGADADGNEIPQVVFYDEGVGTLEGESMEGGGFGDGLEQNIKDAYAFLVFNYNPGDEVFIFGFSRGAYTARSLAGMIRNCGIVRRDCSPCVGEAFDLYKDKKRHPDAEESWAFRERTGHKDMWVSRDVIGPGRSHTVRSDLKNENQLVITYLGVWDTVGQLGVPGVFNAVANKPEDHGFHDLKLSSFVKQARHAVAIDEKRTVFRPTLWEPKKLALLNQKTSGIEVAPEDNSNAPRLYQQKWFAGDHGSVGGGGDLTGLSDIALSWVAEGARMNGANLSYDENFKCVDFEVKYNKGRSIKSRRVRFNANGHAPLSNVSEDYKGSSSVLGRALGYAMNIGQRDRLADLPSLDDFHLSAKSYAGYDQKDMNYPNDLVDRLKAYTQYRHKDIYKHFPSYVKDV